MADLTTQNITIAAPELDLVGSLTAAASGGDTAEISSNVIFVVNNGSGSTLNVTVTTPGTVDGHAITNATMAVLAGDVGVMPMGNVFRNAAGRAAITYDAVTTVTVGVFKIGV